MALAQNSRNHPILTGSTSPSGPEAGALSEPSDRRRERRRKEERILVVGTEGQREAALEALREHVDARQRQLLEQVDGHRPLHALRLLFDGFARSCASEGGLRGCLILRSAYDANGDDEEVQGLVRTAFKSQERVLRNLIAQGQLDGDIEASLDAPTTAKAMTAILIGMCVLARSGSSRGTIEALAHQAVALVDR